MGGNRKKGRPNASTPARRDATAVSAGSRVRDEQQLEMMPGAIEVSRHTFHVGPIPAPETLAEYNQVVPGLAREIVDMAKAEGEHRRWVEKALVRLSLGGMVSAAAISLLIVGGSLYVLSQGKTIEGLAALLLAMATLAGVFVYGRNKGPPADTTKDQNSQ